MVLRMHVFVARDSLALRASCNLAAVAAQILEGLPLSNLVQPSTYVGLVVSLQPLRCSEFPRPPVRLAPSRDRDRIEI